MIVMQEAADLRVEQAAKTPLSPAPGWHERCSGDKETSRQQIQKGDFGHAVDNPGNFAGALAGWPALTRRRQFDSLVARSCRRRVDY
jgi:hypothetical protein